MSLWGGRFTAGLDPDMEEFNSSLKIDKRMFREDIIGSQVYAGALREVNLITGISIYLQAGHLALDLIRTFFKLAEELELIVKGLDIVLKEWSDGQFVIKNDEDIHTANERRLKELIGSEIGGKLHTGRSRNDQVATDMRLWLMNAIGELATILTDLIKTIVLRAESELEVIFCGYTHLQRAQPVLWSHWLLSYAQYFAGTVFDL